MDEDSTNLNLRVSGIGKLLPRWGGPFTVVEGIGKAAYKLDLPQRMSQFHIVFHVSLIKPYLSNHTQPPPPPEVLDDTPEWTVEQVIALIIILRGRQKRIEYLIHWEGYGDEHNTWEPSANTTNAADLVQDYWPSLLTGERLAAASVMHVAHTDIIAVLL